AFLCQQGPWRTILGGAKREDLRRLQPYYACGPMECTHYDRTGRQRLPRRHRTGARSFPSRAVARHQESTALPARRKPVGAGRTECTRVATGVFPLAERNIVTRNSTFGIFYAY